MKTFTKILALVIALMMVVSVFAACGDKDDKKPTNDNPPAGDTTPGEDDKTPGEDDKTPGEDDKTPGEDDKTPGEDDKTPGEDDKTPEPEPEPEPVLYTPTVGGLQVKGGVEFGWGDDELTLDFEGSKIVVVKADTLAETLDEDLFANRVLKLAGADTFALPGITAANGNFFNPSFTYTFTLNYLVKSGSFKVVAINGDTTRDVATVAADKNTVTFDYSPVEGDTAIAFVTEGENAEIYFGRMSVVLYAVGPSYNQISNGYSFDWASMPAQYVGGDKITVGSIEDETVKAAIIAAGYAEDDVIIANAGNGGEGTGGTAPFTWHADHYVPGRRYSVSYTYYAAGGTGGYFISMGDGVNNHTVHSGAFNKTGVVDTRTFTWKVLDYETGSLTWFSAPKNVYILDITVKIDTSYEPENREDVHVVTKEELEAGYTFDFSENNLPSSGQIYKNLELYFADTENMSAELIETLSAALTEENGFGDTVAHFKGNGIRFSESVNGIFELGKTYTIKMRVWADSNSFSGLWLLPFGADGYQCNGTLVEGGTATPVEGLENVYDVTYTFPVDGEAIMNYGFYYNGAVADNIYIGSIYFGLVPDAE